MGTAPGLAQLLGYHTPSIIGCVSTLTPHTVPTPCVMQLKRLMAQSRNSFAKGDGSAAAGAAAAAAGDGGARGVDALIQPLYLSHEAARLPPSGVLTTGINITVAGSGASASSSLAFIQPELYGAVRAGAGNAAVVAAINALAVAASGGLHAQLLDADAASSPSSSAPAASSTPATSGAGGFGSGRRGSSCYAVPDFAAPLPLAVDPMRKDRPAAVLARSGAFPSLIGAARAPISSTGSGGSLNNSSSGAGLPSTPGRYGSSISSAPLRRQATLGYRYATLLREQAKHKRRGKEISRWEELTGNVPRWCVSFVNDQRMKHLPMFAPVLALGPGQAGYLVADSADVLAAAAGEGGKGKGKKSKKGKKKGKKGKKDKKDGKAEKKAQKSKGTDDDDDDDDEDEEEDEDADEDEDPAAAAMDVDDEGVATGRIGGKAVPAVKRVVRDMRSRVAAMKSLSNDSGSSGKGGSIKSAAGAIASASAGASQRITPTAAAEALSGSLPGARGNEMDLILSLSSKERTHLAYVRMLQGEHARMGWVSTVGRPDVPVHELFRQGQTSPTAAPAQAAAPVSSAAPTHSAAFGGAGVPSSGTSSGPVPVSRFMSDTVAIADFAASLQRSSGMLKSSNVKAAATAAAQLTSAASSSSDPTAPPSSSLRISISSLEGGGGGSNPGSRKPSGAPLPHSCGHGLSALGASTSSLPSTAASASASQPIALALTAVNRPSFVKLRSLREERVKALQAFHSKSGHYHDPDDAGPDGGSSVRPLSYDQKQSVRRLEEHRSGGSTAVEGGPDGFGSPRSPVESGVSATPQSPTGTGLTAAAAAGDPSDTTSSTVTNKWGGGGKALIITDYQPAPDPYGAASSSSAAGDASQAHSSSLSSVSGRVMGIDGLDTAMLWPPTGSGSGSRRHTNQVDTPIAAAASNDQPPTLHRMAIVARQWRSGQPVSDALTMEMSTNAGAAAAAAVTPASSRPSSVALDLHGASILAGGGGGAAVNVGAAASMRNRIAEMKITTRKREAAPVTTFAAGPAGYAFDLWSVASSRQGAECHGSVYGLPGCMPLINEFEDPRRTLGLPRSITLNPVTHASLFGAFAPPSLRHVLDLDPHGNPDEHASTDAYEAALSFFRFHCVPEETVLLRAQPPYGTANRGGLGSRPLLSDNKSMYVLLHGRVRVHTKQISESSGAGRRAWAKLRRALLAQSMFMKGNLIARLDAAARAAKLESESPDAEMAGGSGKAASKDDGSTSLNMSMGITSGDSAINPGMWVEVNAIAAPITLGAHALAAGLPHWSTIATVDPCMLLELKPSSFARLSRAMPTVAAGIHTLASLAEPHRLVSCVPSLVTALADASNRGPAGADHHVLVCSIAALFRPVVLSVGEALYAEGDPADCCYVVVAGQLAITVQSENTGSPAVLAVYGRGTCIGESGIVINGPRATRAVALTSCTLMRLSGASLRTLLQRRPRVWRTVRNAILLRDASQLSRLPVLAFLAGGESETARLAPLTDLFQAVVLTQQPNRLAVPPAVVPAQTAASQSSPSLEQPWDVNHWCVSGITGDFMKALSVCAYGQVEVRGSGKGAAAAGALTSAGEWVGGSSLYTSNHLAEHQALVLPSADASSRQASTGALPISSADSPTNATSGAAAAAAAAPSSAPFLSPTSAGLDSGMAVVLTLRHHHLDALITAMPGGPSRLQVWKQSGGGSIGLLARLHAARDAVASLDAGGGTSSASGDGFRAGGAMPVPMLSKTGSGGRGSSTTGKETKVKVTGANPMQSKLV